MSMLNAVLSGPRYVATLTRTAFDEIVDRMSPLQSAVAKFSAQRVGWYRFMGKKFELSKGDAKIRTILENDMARYEGTPRGVLSAHWLDRFDSNGAKLGLALRGTLPAEDVALIEVAEENGNLEMMFLELARTAGEIEAAKKVFRMSMLSPLTAGVISIISIFTIGFVIVPIFESNFTMVPPERWIGFARKAYKFSQFVQWYGWLVVLAFIGFVMTVRWSMRNYVGKYRSWLDEKILFYKLFRDLQGPIFITQLSSLIGKEAGGVSAMTVGQALVNIQSRTYPWLEWRIEQMLERQQDKPTDLMYILDVGAFDREVYFMLSDLVENGEIEQSMDTIGKDSLAEVKNTIPGRVKNLKVSIMVLVVLCGAAIYATPQLMMNDFKTMIKQAY